MIDVKLIKDSISPAGVRLCTWELTFPRFILPQVLTHRQFSRNTQSSRAIPTTKLIKKIESSMAFPSSWGYNQRGMQAESFVDDPKKLDMLQRTWSSGFDKMLELIEDIQTVAGQKIHKQVVNRLLEPWSHTTMLVSTTYHEHFFRLRCGHEAQPEIQELACKMKEEYESSEPTVIKPGDWHLPLISHEELGSLTLHDLKRIATGRCARVSYLTHAGVRDTDADIRLHDQLLEDGHWSPFEHIATPLADSSKVLGNFRGWKQYRKLFPQREVALEE